MSSVVNNLFVHYFERFLDRTKLCQSEAVQGPVILACKVLSGSHLKAFRSLVVGLGHVVRRSLGRRRAVGENWGCLRVLVPLHVLQSHENARRS